MSRHLAEKQIRQPEKKGAKIPAGLKPYPDFGLDREGYTLGFRMPVFMLGGLLFFLAAMLVRAGTAIQLALFVLSVLLTGAYCFYNLSINFRKGRFFCEGLPVVLACAAGIAAKSYAASFFIMLLYQGMKLVELAAVRRQQELAQELVNILPGSAVKLDEEGVEHKIKPSHIRTGDLLLVKAGEIIPVDGIVEEGMSSVELGPLIASGKVIPAAVGHEVIGGCINLSLPLQVRATCDFNASTAKRLYSSFSSIIRRQSEDEKLAVKAGNILYPAMLGCFLLFGILVPLFTGDWSSWLRRGMVFLLCASPYALTGALSLCVFSGAESIFAAGAIIHDISVLPKLAKLETFICNKTCTVTDSSYKVTEACPSGVSVETLLSVMVKAECRSVHPIAEAIRSYAGDIREGDTSNLHIEELPCRGISATLDGTPFYVGNAALLFERGINCPVPEGQGVAIHAAVNGKYIGYVLLENPVRQGNFEAIEQMRACGVKNFALLSGDLRSVVRPIAASLNFNVVKAELKPDGKLAAAEYLNNNKTPGRTLAVLGDSNQEKGTAACADLYVTTAALGRKEAADADVVILSEGISIFPLVVKAGRATEYISFFSLAAHFALRLLLTVLALIGVCPPVLAGCLLALLSAAEYLFASYLFKRV